MGDDFETALQAALTTHQRKARRAIGMSVGVGLLATGGVIALGLAHQAPFEKVVILGAGLTIALLVRNLSSAGLRKLRGTEPLHWAPSPSHGVIVVTSKAVLAGGLAELKLDRSAMHRCDGAGYDDATHELILQEVSTTSANGESSDRHARHRVKLASSVSAAEGLSLSLRITQLAAR